ncbi:MAG: RIP metalloprotease RseP [Bacteroidota bacterium]|nr:RIP metalloprotease RseP [Bacteroidota bacterium]MDP4232046.1 RIP metalloprotease RseP [Bacteroidota bacterium]MDP4241247.1 RIP metalloprotease RseP [Bacteroidota bacterium]MDP4286639.1 RIP metalloprotease RseP [Bacteroidota bacterium]
MEHFILGEIGTLLAPTLSVLSAILYFVITIFVLVSVHEFGHFIAGRIFGMRVPIYSIGMGQRVFGWNKIDGLTFGGLRPETEIQLTANTDYRLSALPIGGYAKIEGMIDETQSEALPAEIQPWEFRAKPWWQKTIVILAGVIMNTLLAWGIFAGHNFAIGEDMRMTTTVGSVDHASQSKAAGVMPGDKIVAIDGKPVDNWEEIGRDAILQHVGKDFAITYTRDGREFEVAYHTAKMASPDDIAIALGLTPIGYGPPSIGEVLKNTPAEHAGLKAGDVITHIEGDTVAGSESLIAHISANPLKPIPLEWRREGQVMSTTITPDATGKIGIQVMGAPYTGPRKHVDYSIPQAAGIGWTQLSTYAALTVKMIGTVITGKTPVSHALGGPIKIAQLASQSAQGGFESFVLFMALLSLSLAMLNVLPIPALDGGHLLIILVEAVIGHELSQRFKLGFQRVGVAILLSLMLFMVINDIRSL